VHVGARSISLTYLSHACEHDFLLKTNGYGIFEASPLRDFCATPAQIRFVRGHPR
jgi:hypothetical protein